MIGGWGRPRRYPTLWSCRRGARWLSGIYSIVGPLGFSRSTADWISETKYSVVAKPASLHFASSIPASVCRSFARSFATADERLMLADRLLEQILNSLEPTTADQMLMIFSFALFGTSFYRRFKWKRIPSTVFCHCIIALSSQNRSNGFLSQFIYLFTMSKARR